MSVLASGSFCDLLAMLLADGRLPPPCYLYATSTIIQVQQPPSFSPSWAIHARFRELLHMHHRIKVVWASCISAMNKAYKNACNSSSTYVPTPELGLSTRLCSSIINFSRGYPRRYWKTLDPSRGATPHGSTPFVSFSTPLMARFY